MNAHKPNEAFMPSSYIQSTNGLQVPLDGVELLSVEDIITDDHDDDMADRDILDRQFWSGRSLEQNMVRNAYLHAWEIGAISAPKAIASLIEARLFDFDLVMDMLVAHSRASAIIDGGAC
jgi:hypothetical protein